MFWGLWEHIPQWKESKDKVKDKQGTEEKEKEGKDEKGAWWAKDKWKRGTL